MLIVHKPSATGNLQFVDCRLVPGLKSVQSGHTFLMINLDHTMRGRTWGRARLGRHLAFGRIHSLQNVVHGTTNGQCPELSEVNEITEFLGKD